MHAKSARRLPALGWLLWSGSLLLALAPASYGQSQPAPSAEASFSRQKALILQQQSERRAALDRAQRCVQAATSSAALRTCMTQQMGPGMGMGMGTGMGCPMAPGPW
jgi:hypothetical protein